MSWSYEKNERFIFLDDAVWIDDVHVLYGRQNWLEASFSPEQLANSATSGWDADPDENGLANAFEYLLGRDPMSHTPAPSGWLQAEKGPLAGPGSGPDLLGLLLELPLTLPDDLVLVVEHAEGLMNWLPLASKTGNSPWTPLNGGLISESISVNGRITRIYHPDPPGVTPTRFLRLQIQLPPP